MPSRKDEIFILAWAKKIMAARLLGGKCEICGNDDVFCLDFHHIGKKEFDVSDYRSSRWSNIEKEIKECKLLCRNCHAELHCDSNTKRHDRKTQILDSIGGVKCEKCSYMGKNHASLDFHHLKDKKFIISDRLGNECKAIATVQELMDEISKCTVLCKNCHTKLHMNVDRFNALKDLIIEKVETYRELRKPLDRDLIFELYNAGKRGYQIAEELKCSRSTISEILTRYKNGIVYRNGTLHKLGSVPEW